LGTQLFSPAEGREGA
jgi:hypothetical protein